MLVFSVVTGRLQAAEVEFSRGKQDLRVSNGTNYTRLGNTMHGSDGSRYDNSGPTTQASYNTGKVDTDPKKNAQKARTAAKKPILPASSRSNVTYRSSTDEYGNITTYGSDGSSSYSSTDEYGNTSLSGGDGTSLRTSTDEYGNTTSYANDGSSSYSSTDEYGNTTTYSGSGNADSAEAEKQAVPQTPTFGF